MLRGGFRGRRTDAQWIGGFWSKVLVTEMSACWVWQGATNLKGYGRYYTGKRWGLSKHVVSSRLAFMFEYGVVLPGVVMVLHRCDNPPCCNPDHLFLGDAQANTTDMILKKRHAHGEANGQHVLTGAQVKEIKREVATGAHYDEVATRFGVASWTVRGIASGHRWKHVA